MRHPFCNPLGGRFALLVFGLLFSILTGIPGVALSQDGSSEATNNRLLSISVDEGALLPTVHIKTETPVGFRYTVYDSTDPVRVVIDLPGMDVSGMVSPARMDTPPLKEIRVSSFDLASGKLGRVELLLSRPAEYVVSLSGDDFRIAFTDGKISAEVAEEGAEGATEPVPAPEGEVRTSTEAEEAEQEVVEAPKAVTPEQEAPAPVDIPVVVPASPARLLESVSLTPGKAVLATDGRIEKYRYFRLGAPPRLVVDIYGVQPGFGKRTFEGGSGISRLRVGAYKDKTRFVFDPEGETLPEHSVSERGNAVIVNWGAENTATPNAAPAPAGLPVTVEGVDFNAEDGKSVLTISLSGPARVTEATAEGDLVRFSVENAVVGRALRRTIDASAFPSAVRLITPYPARDGDVPAVRFAVELKGPVRYSLKGAGETVRFIVQDGPFAETAPARFGQVKVPVPAASVPSPRAVPSQEAEMAESIPDRAFVPSAISVQKPQEPRAYSGERISLVFDNADIRMILQLIAEVSDLNIIAGDEVGGTITLRLIDVPWDQALDLIMDIKGLGMLWEGNVVRILPKETIRSMRQAELAAVKEERELEPLETEIVSVSYTALGNVAGPARELLTERGKLTEDNRNKQLIVTDIASVIQNVKNLVEILDTPERQVMIEARIVEAGSDFSRSLGVSWGLSYANDPTAGGPWDLSSGDISGGGSFTITPSVGSAGLGTSFTFGRLGIDSTVLDLKISALESSGFGKIVSTPRVSTLNGEAATISQGTKIPYTSSGTDGLPKTEFVDANLELTVTPVINPDDSVILNISTSNSSPSVTEGASQPSIDTKEANTKVLVRDGETTVIGGIFVEDEDYTESGIPLLRKIPILGHLFKSSTTTSNRSELLIFITPRIVR